MSMLTSALSIASILSGVAKVSSVDLPAADAALDVSTCSATVKDGSGVAMMQAKREIPRVKDPVMPGMERSMVGKMKDQLWDQTWAFVKPNTVQTEEKIKFMYDAVKLVNALEVPGDIVEAGVWKGGASMAMALAQLRTSEGSDRQIWLYDTFEGMPPPASVHDDPKAKEIYDKLKAGDEWAIAHHPNENGKWDYAAESLVSGNMASTRFPAEKAHLIKGKVGETLDPESNLPEKIAILRLDTDTYDSTRAEIAHLLPRLQRGGLLFIDGYCDWKGVREATDEFFATVTSTALHVQDPFCAFAWMPSSASWYE